MGASYCVCNYIDVFVPYAHHSLKRRTELPNIYIKLKFEYSGRKKSVHVY